MIMCSNLWLWAHPQWESPPFWRDSPTMNSKIATSPPLESISDLSNWPQMQIHDHRWMLYKVANLGHCWTITVQRHHQVLLQGSTGCHSCLWYHQPQKLRRCAEFLVEGNPNVHRWWQTLHLHQQVWLLGANNPRRTSCILQRKSNLIFLGECEDR